MSKKRIVIRDKKLKKLLKEGGRKGAEKEFIELIKRAATKSL